MIRFIGFVISDNFLAPRGPRAPPQAEWGLGSWPHARPTCLTWATSLMSASSPTSGSSFFSWLRSVRKPSPILCRTVRDTQLLRSASPLAAHLHRTPSQEILYTGAAQEHGNNNDPISSSHISSGLTSWT